MTANPLLQIDDFPNLIEPTLIVGLDGWFDAGMSGSTAMSTILATSDPVEIGRFDPDQTLDNRARRPIMSIEDSHITQLAWPATTLLAGTDAAGRDLLILTGAEPDFSWDRMTTAIVELAESAGCRMMVYLGAFPAAIPHTRPSALSITTGSRELADSLRGYIRATLDVPAGFVTALDVALNEVGIPAIGIWSQVPHYVSSMSYPAASMALLSGLVDIAGIEIPTDSLSEEVTDTRQHLDVLVAENPQHIQMVNQLEQVVDDEIRSAQDAAMNRSVDGSVFDIDNLPSGDELAAEFQEFLRKRPDDQEP